MTLETVSTDQLREGDIVVLYGMRLVIDRPIGEYMRDSEYGPVFNTPARVLNSDEITDSFIRHFVIADDGRWTIQGNRLARWAREVTA